MNLRRLAPSVLVLALALTVSGPATAHRPDGVPAANPFAGPDGTSSMHGDSAASDTTPWAGPGADPAPPITVPLGGVCPTILAGADGLPQVLCTGYLDRAPTLHLLDPSTGAPLASLTLQKGSLLGGVYAYVDEHGRLVTADGSGDLLMIGHHQTASGWQLSIDRRVPLRPALRRTCGTSDCDAVATVAPGYDGRVWFATAAGRVGYADPATRRVRLRSLGTGSEIVANSIATAPTGTAVVTDHAIYRIRADRRGRIEVVWRRGYDRGPARKPGQLSHGSGATPTFFGPRTGGEYVALTDNARPREHLIVRDARTGRTVCTTPILTPATSGTENSPIGWRDSVYVASTYGYPYPATPDGAGEAEPASADFVGGFQKFRVGPRGCRLVWTSDVASAAVPRLARAENVIYTVERAASGMVWRLVRIDPRTGRELSSSPLGLGPASDTLQMVGTILPQGTLLQGTVGGVVIVPPAAGSAR